MTAVFGTLPFIATLWLLVVVGTAVLEESGTKIAAALKGEAGVKRKTAETQIRHAVRTRANGTMRENVEWRAAA